jgi:hypothetical protein
MSVRTPLIAALLIAGLVLVSAAGTNAANPQASSLILYRSPESQTRDPGIVHLWTTNGKGRDAHEILAIKPSGESDPLRAAYLVPDGIILATVDSKDGNYAEIGFVRRGSTQIQRLFVVRGLYSFRPSPDGRQIAYSRALPVAGKPLFVIARRDGTVVQTLSHMTVPIFNWSSDGERLFSYCPTVRRRELCSYSATTGASTPTNLNLTNANFIPSVSPSGTRVAFYEKLGPAGERIYSTKGAFLRNLIGYSTGYAIWSPDESHLVLQPGVGDASVFSIKTKQVTAFVHKGPANLFILDWR